MIEVRNVSKNYGDKPVIKDVSFDVIPSRILGLVGPNGAGKTTLIRLMTGYLDVDAGHINICGQEIGVRSRDVKKQIGYAPEGAQSYAALTVREYLRFITGIRGFHGKAIEPEVSRVADIFSITSRLNSRISTLSKGYRHRVCLSASLVGDPEVVILDEPTDGLDPIQKIETRDTIRQLAQTKSIVLTSHLLNEIEELCDDIVLLDEGVVRFNGDIQEITRDLKGGRVEFDAQLPCVDEVVARLSEFGLTLEVKASDAGRYQGVVFGQSFHSAEVQDCLAEIFFNMHVKVFSMSVSTSDLQALFKH